jgi:hypothetical protein
VKEGRPQNQKDITDFFLRELALRKKKLEDSSSRRREKGADWYSKLRKKPEQIKEKKIRLRRVYAEKIAKEKRKLIARKAKECVQRRKEAAKKAKEEETQREQDRNDRAIALRLFKKHYKDEFDKRGKSVARHRQGKLEKQLERNFKRTNQRDEDEAKEWVALVEDAKKGDKEKKKIIDDNNYVKEPKSLCYVPAQWLPGFEPTEDEMRSRFPIPEWKGPLVKAHFLGLQEDPNSRYPKKLDH